MKSKIDAILAEIESFNMKDLKSLEEYRIHFLGSKGIVKNLFGELKNQGKGLTSICDP